MNRKTHIYSPDMFDLLIGAFCMSAILLAHMCMHPDFLWARQGAMWMALLMLGSWGLQSIKQGKLRICASPIWLVMLAAGFMFSLYLMPLSPEMLKLLSPATDELYALTSPGYPVHGVTETLSINPKATSQALWQGLMVAMILFVIMNTVRSRRQIITIIVTLALVGVTQIVYGLVEQLFFMPDHGSARDTRYLQCLTGTFCCRHYFSGLLEMIVPLLFGLVIALTPRMTRSAPVSRGLLVFSPFRFSYLQILLSVGLIVLMAGICFSLSRAGVYCLIASGVGFAMVFALVIRLRVKTIALLLVLLVMIGIAVGVGSQMMLERVEPVDAGITFTWQDRVSLWQDSLGLFGEFPLLGTGPGTFRTAMALHGPHHVGPPANTTPHNDCIKILCETGLLGLLVVMAAGFLVLNHLIRKTLEQKEAFYRCIATGAMISICVMIVHCFYAGSLVDVPANSVVFAVILGLWFVAAESGDAHKEPS